jgi:hypothetical protein
VVGAAVVVVGAAVVVVGAAVVVVGAAVVVVGAAVVVVGAAVVVVGAAVVVVGAAVVVVGAAVVVVGAAVVVVGAAVVVVVVVGTARLQMNGRDPMQNLLAQRPWVELSAMTTARTPRHPYVTLLRGWPFPKRQSTPSVQHVMGWGWARQAANEGE